MLENEMLCYSHNVPSEHRTCKNCVLNEAGSAVCSDEYRAKQQKQSAPCPKWDGGAIAHF